MFGMLKGSEGHDGGDSCAAVADEMVRVLIAETVAPATELVWAGAEPAARATDVSSIGDWCQLHR